MSETSVHEEPGEALFILSRLPDYHHLPYEVPLTRTPYVRRSENGYGNSDRGDSFPSLSEDLRKLAQAGRFDVCSASARLIRGRPQTSRRSFLYPALSEERKNPKPYHPALYKAYTRSGRTVSLFKPLLSDSCIFDCRYCPNTSVLKKRRCSLSPEKMARTFYHLWKTGEAEGFFLSSGVRRDEISSMEDMIRTAEIVREVYGFKGFIHLKILPGVPYHLVVRAAELADRLSVNLEAPSSGRLSELSSSKSYSSDLVRELRYIHHCEKRGLIPAGSTTQYVVWTEGATDRELLRNVQWTTATFGLKRTYFSGFEPVLGTPMEALPPAPKWRILRLYQCEWLLRKYRFPFSEVVSAVDEEGRLPNRDPKITLAYLFFDGPTDVNEASFEELIRIPGIGPKTASAIVKRRQKERILSWRTLSSLGVIRSRAEPFLKVAGKIQKRIDCFGELPENHL